MAGFVKQQVKVTPRPDGALIVTSPHPVPPVAASTGAWLDQWAQAAPDRVALAERSGPGWREETYAGLRQRVRAVAGGLLDRFAPGDRIAFLSGNGMDHLILGLAAQYVGLVSVPLAEQYALVPEAVGRLLFALDKARPKAVFAADPAALARVLMRPELAGMTVLAGTARGAPRPVVTLDDLARAGEARAWVDAAHARVTHATVAKVLFTSGSSADPKGVITTQGMMCVNQAQIAAAWPFLSARPPRLLDWLPWNHVFGGSKNVNLVLAHGGTLCIDHGKPTAQGFATTLTNIRARPGTLSFNVPVAYALLVEACRADPGLARAFFSDLDLIFYAGASLPQPVWEALERLSLEHRGSLPLMASSWGMTETAPSAIMVQEPPGRSGLIGVPLPGVTLKLLPDPDGRAELRVKGPNVMPGYLDDPERTAAAFDDEGFLVTGDAVRFADPADPGRGLAFDGRVSEDFKLTTGTWVQAGRLRLDALRHLQGLAQDVVICGHDRGEIGLFIFPVAARARGLDQSDGALTDPPLLAEAEAALRAMNAGVTGSAKRITRALILAEPPSLALHEVTDKGSLNIRRILTRRADLLERLYDNEDPGLIRV